MSRIICLALAALLGTSGTQGTWPNVSSEMRPWTRWWWLGSAFDEATIARELASLRDAGFGGVEITPIYGVRGQESRFVPYLSDAWLKLLGVVIAPLRIARP